eukprot:gene9655-biopygen59
MCTYLLLGVLLVKAARWAHRAKDAITAAPHTFVIRCLPAPAGVHMHNQKRVVRHGIAGPLQDGCGVTTRWVQDYCKTQGYPSNLILNGTMKASCEANRNI